MACKPPRHKLNLLEPGLKLCACMGILFAAGLVLLFFGLQGFGALLLALAGLLLVALLILIAVEQRQDRKLYLQAKAEDPDIP